MPAVKLVAVAEKLPVPKEPFSVVLLSAVVGVPPAPVTQHIPLAVAFSPPVAVIELVSKTAEVVVMLVGEASVETVGASFIPTKLGDSRPYLR